MRNCRQEQSQKLGKPAQAIRSGRVGSAGAGGPPWGPPHLPGMGQGLPSPAAAGSASQHCHLLPWLPAQPAAQRGGRGIKLGFEKALCYCVKKAKGENSPSSYFFQRTRFHILIYVSIFIYMYMRTLIYVSIFIYMYMSILIYVSIFIYIYMRTLIYVSIFIYMYMSILIYMWIYMCRSIHNRYSSVIL